MSEEVQISFVSRSILHTHEFSWVFLVDWLLVLALSVFVLFYFNQLLGFLCTNTFGWYLWHRYGIYLKIQSIQISLLGGRIIFRNIVYIGTSQAVRVVHGTLSWRYWIQRRRRAAFLNNVHTLDTEEAEPPHSHPTAPNTDENVQSKYTFNPSGSSDLALNLKLHGVEWFVYNREYAYTSLSKQEPATAELAREFEQLQNGLSFAERKLVQLLPLHVDVHTLGAVFGNDDTESLMVLAAQRVNCVVDMAAPSTAADRYMNVIDARFRRVTAQVRDNIDYQVSSITPEKQSRNLSSKARRRKWMKNLIRRSKKEPREPWFGLKRYVDPEDFGESNAGEPETGDKLAEKPQPVDEEGFGESRNTPPDSPSEGANKIRNGKVLAYLASLPAEYAKVTQLLTCDTLDFQFRVDVVGPARDRSRDIAQDSSEDDRDSGKERENEYIPPLFNTHMVFHDTKLNYGPYAERQRQMFFHMFFPQNCTAEPMPNPTSFNGLRVHTHANVSIELRDETTLMVPIREKSKDEAFASHVVEVMQSSIGGGEIQRSYGWLEIRALEGSRIDVLIPFVPKKDHTNSQDAMGGYSTEFMVNLLRPTVRTSVNHDTCFTSNHYNLRAVQYQPNAFNALITYNIDSFFDSMDVFLLREHATLFSDLAIDFSTGPMVSYHLFAPSIYYLNSDISKFALYLNVNKGNIINKPCSLSENLFLILKTPKLHVSRKIPRTKITSPVNIIEGIIEAAHVDLELSAPNWHTLQGFLDCERMATVKNFRVESREYTTTITRSPSENDSQFETERSRFVDTQIFEVSGDNFALAAHGFLIEYIMRIRENYFGHAYHFKTKEEFVERMNEKTENSVQNAYEFKRSDVDNDVILKIRASKGCFLLPQQLFSCKDCVMLQFVEMNVDMRFTNYYMDLQLEIAPVMGRNIMGLNPGTAFEEAISSSANNADLSISNLEIHAHRMFGLPPVEPTYVVRWDFYVGDITADLHMSFLRALADVAMVFGPSMDDDENKPVTKAEELNDVTFLSLKVSSIDITVRPYFSPTIEYEKLKRLHDKTRWQLCTSSINVLMNDLANTQYSAKTSVEIPFVRLRAFTKVKGVDSMVLDAETAIKITNFTQKAFMKEQFRKQQEHIALHDHLYQRSEFLLTKETKSKYPYTRKGKHDDIKPCIAIPSLPLPITPENYEELSTELFMPAFSGRKSSAWSSDSSGNTSVRSLVNDNSRDSFSSSAESEFDSESEHDEIDDLSFPSKAKKARANQAGPPPEVYPFSSRSMTEERNKIRNATALFEFKTGPWNTGNHVVVEVDDDMEHDNVLILIKPIHARITPDLFLAVDAFALEGETFDFEKQLDRLQIIILRGVGREKRIVPSRRFYVSAPSIDLHFSDELDSRYGGIRFFLDGADLKLHLINEQLRGIHAEFANMTLSLGQGSALPIDSKPNAAAIILSKFEFWWQQSAQETSIGSLGLNGIDISFAADQIEWSFKYVSQLVEAILAARASSQSSALTKKGLMSRQDELKTTFYALTVAGEKMRLEQDSYVLSKPSGTIQSKDHVRAIMSWRIVMRLRFLLQRISPLERKKMEDEISQGSFELPEDASEQMLDIYRNWRSWEQSKNLKDTEIFKHLFNDLSFQEYVLSLSIKIKMKVESMVIRAVYPDMHDHFAGLDSLRVILASTQKNKVQNLNLAVQCAKIRAKGSMELINVSVSFMKSLAEFQNRLADRNIPRSRMKPDNDTHSIVSAAKARVRTMKPSLKNSSTKNTASRAFQANISVFLLDLILEFNLEHIHIETQNHQIQFTSAVELTDTSNPESLFHIGTLVSSDGAFRVYKSQTKPGKHDKFYLDRNSLRHLDVFDALAQGVQATYASRGYGDQCRTWTTLNIDTTSVMSHLTAIDLALLTVDFLETELPAIRKAAEALANASAEYDNSKKKHNRTADDRVEPIDSPTSVKSEKSGVRSEVFDDEDDGEDSVAGNLMHVTLGTVKMKTRLVDELRFVWLAKTVALKIISFGGTVGSLSVDRSTFGVHLSDAYEAVANIHFEMLRMGLKYDPTIPELTIFTNADAVRLGTMSLMWILEYAKHRHIGHKLIKVISVLNKITSLIHEDSKEQQDLEKRSLSDVHSTDSSSSGSSILSSSGINMRLINQIEELSLRLPLDTNSFQLTIDGVYTHFENMRQSVDEPRSISGGIRDLKLVLLSDTHGLRQLIRTQFDMSAHKFGDRILLNFASEYLKFGLDPESVCAVYAATEKLKLYSQHFSSSKITQEAAATIDNPQSPKEPNKPPSVSELENIRIKLASKNANFTWFTDMSSNKGIVMGYENLELKFSKLVACLHLESAYITPVREGALEIPFKERNNTIYLPLLKAFAIVKQSHNQEKPCVHIQVSGESVTLKLVPSVAPWILSLADSASETSKQLNALSRKSAVNYAGGNSYQELEITKQRSKQRKPLEIPFDFNMNMKIARSVIRLFDESGRQSEPSVELFSPSVGVIVCLENQHFLVRINASQTKNKLYPKAISEIKAITTLISEGFKKRSEQDRTKSKSQTGGKSKSENSDTTKASSVSIKQEEMSVLSTKHGSKHTLSDEKKPEKPDNMIFSPVEGMEIDFRLHLEEQELELSCMPFGRVSTFLVTEGVDLLIMTPKILDESGCRESLLTVFCVMKRTGIALQHMYSSDRSGLIEFSNLAILGMLYSSEPLKLAANMRDPIFDLKLSKLHDMRVFFDTWSLYENPVNAETPPEVVPESTQLRRKFSASSPSRPVFNTPKRTDSSSKSLFSVEDEDTLLDSDNNQQEASADKDDSTSSDEDLSKEGNAGLFDRYKSAVAAVPVALIVNLNLLNAKVILGMGPSIGDVHITIDHMWAALLQTTEMEQMFNLGLSSFAAKFEGRLGGIIELRNLVMKAAIKWKDNRTYPVMHAKTKFEELGFYFSLDFHPFVAGNIENLATVITTQDSQDVQEDRINMAVTCKSVSLLVTALVAVHSMDILALFKRLHSQVSSAPIFILPELSAETAARNAKRHEIRAKRVRAHQRKVSGIRVIMDVQLGKFLAHAFPTEFADNVSLRVFAKRLEIHYDRSHYTDRWESSMDFAVDESDIGLANIRDGGYKKNLTDLNYKSLIDFVAKTSSGGTIVSTPEATMVLDTWQYKNDVRKVYYKFSNEVRGTIDVGWNLGSVNFIKEMLSTHKGAYDARQEFYETSMQKIDDGNRSAQAYREAAANLEHQNSLRSQSSRVSLLSKTDDRDETASLKSTKTTSDAISSSETTSSSASDFMEFQGLRYIARESPVVHIPQLRDLGDATPPIEWLGVNRERIPLFVHAFLMKKLGYAADEAEKIYLEVVGRM